MTHEWLSEDLGSEGFILDSDEQAEEITYTADGEDAATIYGIVNRQQNQEVYVRGPDFGVCTVIVSTDDVPTPKHGDAYAFNNPNGEAETWQYTRVITGNLYYWEIELERVEGE